MRPQPWSHSRLSSFENCPRSYHATTVAKTVQDVKGEATIWGEEVHKHFEARLGDGVALPATLDMHEPFLNYLDSLPGERLVEARIALDTQLRPCEFFGSDVWYRGVIDYGKVNGVSAKLYDHKTGKFHSKFGQLKLFAIHTFIAYPDVEEIRAEYYWTQSKTTNGETYTRDMIPKLWSEFTPSLKQYAQAYLTNTWQPRPSGLCKRHCAVTDCEFNGLGSPRGYRR